MFSPKLPFGLNQISVPEVFNTFHILHFCVHTAAFDRAFQLIFCRHFHKGPRLAAYILQFLLHICHFVCKLSKPSVNFPFRTKNRDITRALKIVPSCYPEWENMEQFGRTRRTWRIQRAWNDGKHQPDDSAYNSKQHICDTKHSIYGDG